MDTGAILKFEPNVPIQVALQYATGKRCANARVMYTLTSGDKMFLNAPEADRVDALGVKPGEAFTICQVGKGKNVQWAIGRGQEASPGRTQTTRSQSGTDAHNAEPVARRAAPLRFAPMPTESADQVLSRKLVASADNSMRSYLKAAVSAAADTEKYAASIGRHLEFSAGDVLTAAIFLAQMGGR